jgi:uncharacterized membrane protein
MKSVIRNVAGFLAAGFAATANAMQDQAPAMTNHSNMMDGGMMTMMGGGMMIACILFGVLVVVALVLGILALVKYLRKKD